MQKKGSSRVKRSAPLSSEGTRSRQRQAIWLSWLMALDYLRATGYQLWTMGQDYSCGTAPDSHRSFPFQPHDGAPWPC
jgi:hypothetical protein